MKTYSYKTISDWFLSKQSMTPKKLQKLTYYTEAWSNALYNQSIIDDTHFEAWVHGPASYDLYKDYKEYGWQLIDKKESNNNLFDEEALDLLESVWITYGDKSANELEALTHSERPWIEARMGCSETENSHQIISAEAMKEYYKGIYIGD